VRYPATLLSAATPRLGVAERSRHLQWRGTPGRAWHTHDRAGHAKLSAATPFIGPAERIRAPEGLGRRVDHSTRATDQACKAFHRNPSLGKAESTSTISYTAEGLAVGPYPGTFRESGTFKQVELTNPPAPESRAIQDFQAQFTTEPLTSRLPRVTGTKSASDVPFGTGGRTLVSP
jgi:hypothetical protein